MPVSPSSHNHPTSQPELYKSTDILRRYLFHKNGVRTQTITVNDVLCFYSIDMGSFGINACASKTITAEWNNKKRTIIELSERKQKECMNCLQIFITQ